MEDLNFSVDDTSSLWRIVAAVLKLGNLNFVPTTNMDGTEGCAVANDYGEMWERFEDNCLAYMDKCMLIGHRMTLELFT